MNRSAKRILIADDDQSILGVSSRCLASAGYQVETCASAAAAEEKIKSSHFDVLITDYHLGDGTGTELISLIKARSKGTKTLLMTGDHELEGTRGPASPYADADALMKPFPVQQLLELVDMLTESNTDQDSCVPSHPHTQESSFSR